MRFLIDKRGEGEDIPFTPAMLSASVLFVLAYLLYDNIPAPICIAFAIVGSVLLVSSFWATMAGDRVLSFARHVEDRLENWLKHQAILVRLFVTLACWSLASLYPLILLVMLIIAKRRGDFPAPDAG